MIALAFLVLPAGAPEAGAQLTETVPPGSDASLRNRVEQLGRVPGILNEQVHAIASVRRFYEWNGFARVWTSPGEILARADSALALLGEARDHGLSADHYHRAALASASLRAQPIQFEILMTDALLLYAAHLLGGKVDPVDIDPDWHARRPEGDVVAPLLEALETGDLRGALGRLAPQEPSYSALRRELARYRGIVESWYTLPSGPVVKPGESDERIPAIRERVARYAAIDPRMPSPAVEDGVPAVEAGVPAGLPDETYDAALEAAVRTFQRLHGLGVDGSIGPATMYWLNRSPLERLHQIRANMERYRWLPRDFGERYILVNIAAYALRYQDGASDSLDMRVIVGRDYRRTPVFADSISYLVLNPSWEVPRSILVQDLLPLAKKNPNYFAENQFEILSGWGANATRIDPASIDWSDGVSARFPYRLQQRPGPKNALGRVKFMFPNAYSVYLHDTNSPALFEKPDRALSSGCIRVEKPVELTERLLRMERNWPMSRVREVWSSRVETTVRFGRKVPVYLIYLTTWCDEHGEIQFRRDIYSRDADLVAALDEPPPGTVGQRGECRSPSSSWRSLRGSRSGSTNGSPRSKSRSTATRSRTRRSAR